MQEKDKVKFANILASLHEIFNISFTPPSVQMIFSILSKYEYEKIAQAIEKILVSETKRPVNIVALIIEYIEGKEIDRAAEQANTVIEMVHKLGHWWGTPSFTDPITSYLLSTRWTWRGVCDVSEAELKWFVRDFKEAYLEAKRSGSYLRHTLTPIQIAFSDENKINRLIL